MSGRELLTFNPELFIIDDDDVMDVEEYKKETDGVEQGEEEKEEKKVFTILKMKKMQMILPRTMLPL